MATQETGQVTGTKDKDYDVIWFTEQCLSPAAAMVTEVEKAILEWAEGPIRDDLCVLVLKPQ